MTALWSQQKAIDKLLLSFWQEVEMNLESYYVMFQLGKLRFFAMQVWPLIQSCAEFLLDEQLSRYGERLADYNNVLDDFRKYEQWYAADIKNKTKENGLVLTAKRDAAQAKFDAGLEEVIKTALISLQGRLLAMKILKEKSRFLERV